MDGLMHEWKIWISLGILEDDGWMDGCVDVRMYGKDAGWKNEKDG